MAQLAQLIYEFLNWQYAGVVLIIWGLVDIIWVKRWRDLFRRVGKIIAKPIIFKVDKEPEVPSFLYPRSLLEQITGTEEITASDNVTASKLVSKSLLAQWSESLQKSAFDVQSPLKVVGNIVSFFALLFFVLAEGVLIAHTMVLLGLADQLWPVFSYFTLDTALIGGTVAIGVVGFWYFIELLEDESDNVSMGHVKGGRSKFLRAVAILSVFGGVFVALGLSFDRLIALGFLTSSNTSDIILSFIKFGVTTVNNILGAILTFVPALSGVTALLFILVGLIILIRKPLMFFVDLAWRAGFVATDILLWALLTPIIAIPASVGKLLGFFNNESKEQVDEEDVK